MRFSSLWNKKRNEGNTMKKKKLKTPPEQVIKKIVNIVEARRG